MNINKLKYIHGALVIAQAKADGREIEIIKSAISMIEKELAPQDKTLSASCNSDAVDSEMAANEILTTEIERKDKLIERMREALRLALPEARSTHVEQTILAALAAEGELK